MSFIDNIVNLGKTAFNFLTGNSLGSNIVSTILTGYALNQVTDSMNKGNDNKTTSVTQTQQKETGNRLQLPPATENKIPVVYGRATAGGVITDAKMSSDNQKMTLCLTISEVTGTKISDGQASEIEFLDVYVNNNRVIFKSDGVTADYMMDPDGNVDRSIKDLVKVYCYKNGSTSPAVLDNYINGAPGTAWSVMPGWTSSHTMNSLAFAIVEVTYNRSKNVTTIPNFTFDIRNSMTQPGDCLYDYMTNTRYGAGIDPLEIKSA